MIKCTFYLLFGLFIGLFAHLVISLDGLHQILKERIRIVLGHITTETRIIAIGSITWKRLRSWCAMPAYVSAIVGFHGKLAPVFKHHLYYY